MDERKSVSIKGRGGFRPGSGRKPGVPNKLTADIKALASEYGPEALETLVHIMTEGESEQAQIAAAKELLDRGYGKPRQEFEVNEKPRVTVIVQRYGPVADPRPALTDQTTDEGDTRRG